MNIVFYYICKIFSRLIFVSILYSYLLGYNSNSVLTPWVFFLDFMHSQTIQFIGINEYY